MPGGYGSKQELHCGTEHVTYLAGWGGRGGSTKLGTSYGSPGVRGAFDSEEPQLAGIGPGRAGANGSNGTAGRVNTFVFGAITNEGEYVASNAGTDGTRGTVGRPGDGGTGGNSVNSPTELAAWYIGGGGGEGGAPGCGGAPGHGGGGGGAAVALLSIDSQVDLYDVGLHTGNGGDGGHPSAGSPGQLGGAPGWGGSGMPFPSGAPGSPNGLDGGRGGDGGAGGPGAPGGGGPSIGIVSVGPQPHTTLLHDTKLGSGGLSGKPLAGGAPANPGLSAENYTYAAP